MYKRYWRGLSASVAVALSVMVFGVLGGLMMATAMCVLWRWPKVQIITGTAFASVFFVVAVLLQGHTPMHAPAATDPAPAQLSVVVATSPAIVEPDAANRELEHDRWDADARAFIRSHPDLSVGDNLRVMDAYTRILAASNRNFLNAEILQAAYADATRDPHWSTIEAAAPSGRGRR
jgi:hypothetical protein